MNDTTLVFIEACPDCGRVQRVSSKRAPRKAAALCPDCAAAQREHGSSGAGAEGEDDRRS